MEENLLPALPAAPLSYPTIKESWGALGWVVLCTIGVALLVLVPVRVLLHQQGPAKQLTTALVGEGGLLFTSWWLHRRAGAARWPHLVWQEENVPWTLYALLLALVPAQAVLLTTLSLLALPNWMQKTFMDWSHHPALAFGIGSVVGPVLEEYLFRGILLRGLLRNYRPWVAIGQSALLFGIVHFNPAQSLSAALIGLLLGWLYYRTRSLGLCIGLHMLNNAFAFLLLRLATTPHYAAASKHLGAGGYWFLVAASALVLAACFWRINQLPLPAAAAKAGALPME